MTQTIGRVAIAPVLAKLSHFTALSNHDTRTLSDSLGNEVRFAARQTICHEGDRPGTAFVILRGMACRYRYLKDGRRQILTFLLPGDFFNLNGSLLRAMCYSVLTLSPVTAVTIERDSITTLISNYPRLSAALRWCAQQDEAILHERVIALGRQNARARVAFLLCEMVCRQQAVALSGDHSIRLPLTQLDIADALGLTAVHVNRVLQELRRRNLIQLNRGRLTLLDYEQLCDIAEFSGAYLQLEGVTEGTARYLHQLLIALDDNSTFLIDTANSLRRLSERAPGIAHELLNCADELDARRSIT
jgi:CRP-like cAMP-binding protein